MRPDLLRLALQRREQREAYAMARVVRRLPPSSARVGDTALITRTGQLHGWIGGACSRDEVIRQALDAIRERQPRLLAFAPGSEPTRSGLIDLPMNCQSGGTVEVFIEPVLPVSRLVVYGSSPIAEALARLGNAMGYAITLAAPDAAPETLPASVRVETDYVSSACQEAQDAVLAIVVASMGHGDERALRLALEGEPEYAAMVASARRFAQVRETLIGAGVAAELLDRVHSPAGLDIGARSHEEIALSILAEIVQQRRAAAEALTEAADPIVMAVDPVCGMEVPQDGSRPSWEHDGRTIWFCCEGCRERFAADPTRYAEAVE